MTVRSSAAAEAALDAFAEFEAAWTEERDTAAAAGELQRLVGHPTAFCRHVLGWDLWSKQREILESVATHKRTAVRSGNGIGKTRAAAAAALWFLAAYTRSKVITTAPIHRQVRQQLWREIHTGVRTARERGHFTSARLTSTSIELDDEWFAVGFTAAGPVAFQGTHAEHILFVVDEASGVEQDIVDAIEGSLGSAGARLLMLGNPTATSGPFFDAFNSKRDHYNLIHLAVTESPDFTDERDRVSDDLLRALHGRAWVDEMRALWRVDVNPDDPRWHIRVLGNFPTRDSYGVVSLADLEEAVELEQPFNPPVVIACDVARFGDDQTAVVERTGQRVRIAEFAGRPAIWGGQDTEETADRVLAIARQARRRYEVPMTIVIDDVGVGGGVTDKLRVARADDLRQLEAHVVAYNGAAAPADPSSYPNRRSEDWFGLAESLRTIDLDPSDELASDLLAPRYSFDARGGYQRRKLEAKEETKKRLKRSPDLGDAVVMAFAVTGRPRDAYDPSEDTQPADDLLARRRVLQGQGSLVAERVAPGMPL